MVADRARVATKNFRHRFLHAFHQRFSVIFYILCTALPEEDTSEDL